MLAETLYGRLLRNLGLRDRTAVVSDNSTQNECTAGNRDMIAEYRSLNRTALVVYRTDRACRSLVAGDERYPVIRAADAAAPDRTVVFAGNAACIAVVTGDAAVADTVLDRAARAVHADNAACRTDICGHPDRDSSRTAKQPLRPPARRQRRLHCPPLRGPLPPDWSGS